MRFWKKKEKKEPEATTTNPFEQSDAPQQPPARVDSPQGRYGTSNNNYQQDRQNLFNGYNDKPNQSAQRTSGNDGYNVQETEEDEDVAQLQKQIRNVKQDTLQSTRNALQKISETEDSAANTMNMLGQQSTQIANVDRNLDMSKAYSDRASSQAGELKQLNRSIFIPVIKNPLTRGNRQKDEIDRLQRDHDEHLAERDNIRQFEYDSSIRIDDAMRKAGREKAKEGYHKGRSESDRRRYQFEADEEDDAVEDEIDSNLDLLGDATARLRAMATTMNDELDSQNKQLNKINKKVDPINSKLISTTYTLNSTR